MKLAACVVALAGLGFVSGTRADATPAGIASPEGSQQIGQVTLFENPDFTGTAWRRSYTDCPVGQATVQGQVRSFDNRPPAGCQVVLLQGAQSFTLCAGRGTVPFAFQRSPLVRIQPGYSPTCTV